MFECSAPIEMIPSKDQIEQYAEKIDTKKSQGGDLIPLSILNTKSGKEIVLKAIQKAMKTDIPNKT